MNCEESDGISEFCLGCEQGFILKDSICIRRVKNEYNCLKFNEQDECLKCKRLYYLSQGICIKVDITDDCIMTNGISNACSKCSLRGFTLDL